MAKSAAVACAVIGIANIVGLARIPARHQPSGREPQARQAASEPVAGRAAYRLGVGRKSSRRVDGGGARELERTGSQPGASLASDSVPSGNRFGIGFWIKANGSTHTER